MFICVPICCDAVATHCSMMPDPFECDYILPLPRGKLGGVNELESNVSYSPPGTGGVAAHQENGAKLPLKAQTGWSFETDHPGRALLNV